jgi:hypothetical protein
MNKTIEIIIDPSGAARLETKGFAGASCRDASRLLERALGTVESATPTAEMYQAAATQAEAVRQHG